MPSHKWMIDHFLAARRAHAFGDQQDWFDDAHGVGWTRTGTEEHPGGMAVVMSNHEDTTLAMCTAAPNTRYRDVTEHVQDPVETNADGWGEFRCHGRSVSVWIPAS